MSRPVLTLPELGETVLALPPQISARRALVRAYWLHKDNDLLLHPVCCAVVGLCWTGERPPLPPPEDGNPPVPDTRSRLPALPRYNLTRGDLLEYGVAVDQVLTAAGAGLYGGFVEAALDIVLWVADTLPDAKKVKEKVNFTFPSTDTKTVSSP